MLERYDPAKGPTPQSVVFSLLEAINHAHLLNTSDRRKVVKLIGKTALGQDIERAALAIRLLDV